MTTGYQDFPLTEPFITSHPKLLSNDKAALSLNAGTAFPTTGVMDGMPCYRTDENKLYVRKGEEWVLCRDLNNSTSEYGSVRDRDSTKPSYGLT